MATTYCPNCNQPITYWPLGGDIAHECNSGNDTVDFEDVPMTNTRIDSSGTTEKPNGIQYTQGQTKSNFGRRSYEEGERVYPLTSRGNRSDTHIQTRREEYIETKNNVIVTGGA